MILPDVNVLVYAHREDTPHHRACRDWLESVVNADSVFGLSDLVAGGFVRIVTHPRIFRWRIFRRLCREAGAKGNLVPDAWFAAMAMEHGCEWITTDGDFARFPGLRWRNPLRG